MARQGQHATTVIFVVGPQCDGPELTRAASLVTRWAGGEGQPGSKPKADGSLPTAPAEPKPKLQRGEETENMQFDRVARKAAIVRRLKGKFVPWGPKPWDPHRFTKVCIQTRLKSKQASNTKIIQQIVEEHRRISGMHPKIVKAKHNVASYGWRVGYPCGVAVSIFGSRMHDFLQRFNTVILPRVRDFEGLFPSSFDNYGNFWMGLPNQEAFKELDSMVDDRVLVHGFDIGILNNCLTQPDGLALMKNFGFPFGDPRAKKAPKKKVAYQVMRGDAKR